MRTRLALIGAIALLAVPTAVPTAVATAKPTSQGRIAFDGLDPAGIEQVFSVRPNGSGFVQLTHVAPDAFAADPSWSADGSLLAYDTSTTDEPADAGIWVMNADGSGQHAVYEEPGVFASQPAFFPDGEKLIFEICRFEGDLEGCGLRSINIDGTGLREITRLGGGVFDFAAKVSHDGRRIAFNRGSQGGFTGRVWVSNTDGTHARAITDPALEAQYPAWSPDDSKLLIASNCCRLGGDLYTVTPDGKQVQQITTTPYPNATQVGVWAPSGTQIAMISNRRYANRAHNDLFTANPDGTGTRRVRLPVEPFFGLSWGPDPT